MKIHTLLAELQSAGIQVRRNGTELAVSGKKAKLSPALIDALRAQKTTLLDMIDHDGWWTPPLIRPEMLPLVELTQAEIDRIVERVPGGAANVQDIYPLAPLQEGMLFHHLMESEGDPYLLPHLIRFDERARLDAFLEALQAVIARHDILRTGVQWEGLPEPVQVVWRKAPLAVEELRLDPADGDVAEQLYERFHPRHFRIHVGQAPLLRAYVAFDAAQERWLLHVLVHHLASDHTTMDVLLGEVSAHLAGRADSLPKPLPFRNFVAQTRLGVSRAEHEAFFQEMLGGVDEPTAPFGLLDARGDGSDVVEAFRDVDAGLGERLRERARRLGVSVASVCHVAFAQVLARVTGRDDAVFGTVLFGRMQGGAGADRVVGPFINTLPVRLEVGAAGAEAGVRAAHARLAELLRHEHASLALAQRCSGVRAPAPLFTALLNYRHSAAAEAPAHDAAPSGIHGLRSEERTNYPLTVSIDDMGAGGFSFKVQVHSSVAPERVGELMHTALEGIVEALENAPQRPLNTLPVLPEAERRLVVEEWNATHHEIPSACVHALFEAQAQRAPDAVAVVYEAESLTYAELNARANRLAHHLAARGVGPGSYVALLLPRSVDLVVAELAILKAGAAYVPIDPTFPESRITYMVADCGARVVVSRSGETLPELGAPVRVDVDGAIDGSDENLSFDQSNDAPAYVMYTSGSTGEPKGVVVPHRAIVRLVIDNGYADFNAGDRVAFAANSAFDASTMEVWAPLLNGGGIVVIDQETLLDVARFATALRTHEVSALWLTVGLFNQYADAIQDEIRRLRYLIVGGDALDPRIIAQVLRRGAPTHLLNGYGPTETTTFAITHEITHVAEGALSIPLGRPISNTRIYILDAQGQPVPVGVAGEIHIGGTGVALGYLNRPELTEERFVADPFAGGRMYRTGDLGRWLNDGTIEFLGRNDFQVKIRGFRIELGEIEARLAEHPELREVVVLAREDAPGDKRLVAYYVADAEQEVEALRTHLQARLPAYMVPAAYVWMERLPLTSNGKLDRKALPAPEGDAFLTRAYEAPQGRTEEALAEIWSDLLGVERVGRHDHFFELGGHSLRAVQLVSRVRQALGIELALGDVFKRPGLAELAREMEGARRAELPPIEIADRDGPLPLSFAQQRLWFLEQMGGLGSTYHMPFGLRLRGELNRDALRCALDRIVERHEGLRTTFPTVAGEPRQRITPAAESAFHLVEQDLAGREDREAEVKRLVVEEATAPFDLCAGPLVRGRLVRVAEDDHVLLVTMHHIVSDGWSMGVMTHELAALYGAFLRGGPDPLPALPVQYADYAVWQRKWVEGEVLQEQAEYWTRSLAGAPELLELPTDRPRAAVRDIHGAAMRLELDVELSAGLKALSQRHGTTLFHTLLAGWATVLGRLAGQDDVVVGTPSANRSRGEIEGLIGFFVNTLAIRVDLAGGPSVAELLAQVKERALGAQQNQDIPFEQVVQQVRPSRSMAHTPLFQVMFAWQNMESGTLELPGLTLGSLRGSEPEHVTAQFDLSLAMWESNGRISGGVEYASALFDRATVERYVGYLHTVLAAMVAADREAVDRLPMLSPAERLRVLEEWNGAEAEFPSESCIHELFEAQAERAPHAVAVIRDEEQLTYGELNARANQLAHHLRTLGVGPDARVAVCVERGVEMVVGLLAVLKAGGGYVPLDPAHPEDRLRYVLEDSAPAVVLTQARLRGLVAGAGVPLIALDEDAAAWAAQPESNPERGGLSADHLAYIIYTSGSTGAPKGVMIEHRPVCQQISALQDAFGLTPGDRVLQFASVTFDVSVEEIFGSLLSGAALVLRDDRWLEGARSFWDRCERHQVSIIDLPTRFWQLLLDDAAPIPACIRLLVIGGEAVDPAALRAWFRRPGHRPRLLNCYGPTETAINDTIQEVVDDAATWRSIGRPITNTRIYILDAHRQPVPVGAAGELYIGGAGVARGYLDRPGLTAERFVADPFAGVPGARMYRTGDLGRWLNDGTIEFVGRNDFQVKIRGFRIELGEIEARLAGHPEVRNAVVLAREDGGDRRLVAYYVADAELPVDGLRAHLQATLPEYMVPAAYVWMAALPLTGNGKLDRKALPAPEGDAFLARGYEAPAGAVESTLAEIWSDLLGVERVGRTDHFFELGGHSLRAVQLVSRVREALGVEVTLADLFTRPVLADFAAGMQGARRAELPPIQAADRGGALPLSFAQQRLWFLEQLSDVGAMYHMPAGLRMRGELDRDALRVALDRIVERHEALRTTFAMVDGEPVQRIVPAEERGFPLLEQDADEAELPRLVAEEASAPFDLANGPVIRCRLVRLAAGDHVLLLTMHHIVSDGWSMGVMTRELAALYDAFRRGEPDPLPALPVQYADYAVWQRKWVEGEVLQEQAEYWMETLRGAPELLELPTDRPRAAVRDHRGAGVALELDETLSAGLKALSQRHGTTLFMTLLAGWATVLGRLSGQEDVVVGTPTANRGRGEIEGLIGFFVNTLALRVDLGGSPTVATLLERVKERALGAQAHQDIPFEQVVERVQPSRSTAHNPLFQAMFSWQAAEQGGLELPGLTLSGVGAGAAEQSTAKFDLTLTLQEEAGRIVGGLTYAAALFDRETMERHLGYLRSVLAAMVAEEQTVDRMPLLSSAERRMVVEDWNATDAEFPSDRCVHALFEAQAERTPDAVSVVHDGRALTYEELNARANRLAHHLRAQGVGAESYVVVLMRRSVELVIAELAILKAGAAYVPIDPTFPAERVAYMVADCGARVVVSRAGESLPELDALVRVDVDGAIEGSDENVSLDQSSEAAAYVMYTSGSTGEPKGVVVPHRAIARLVINNGYADFDAQDRVAFAANPAFDATTMEVWGPLLTGGRTVVIDQDVLLDPTRFARVLDEQGVTALFITTAVFNHYAAAIPEAMGRLRFLMTGGERADVNSFARVLRAGNGEGLIHCYGPTETTTFAITQEIRQVEDGALSVPLGRPISNTRIYILDAHLQPVPVGVAGELYIGGAGVALGYLNRPELTEARFVADPFTDGRMYRTGDLGRWLNDGTIEFLGRNDFQVKIRGFRIELGEIEARLLEHPELREVIVLAREDAPGDKRLVAYYVADAEVPVEALRAHLQANLPEYMVPAAYVWMDQFPLNPNGKLDRKAFPAPDGDAYLTRAYEAPVGEVERTLAEIWAEVLDVERVGRNDHFFELGGHSLRAVQLVSRVRQALGAEVALGDLFARPVLADFAQGMEGAGRAELPAIEAADRGGPLPLSFAQQRLWFLEQLGDLGAMYHMPFGLRLKGELDREALVAALDRIVERHEALRTTFTTVDGEPVQRIAPESAFHLVQHDLRGSGDAEREMRSLVAEEASARFDLEQGPLIRGRLIRMANDDHVLLVTMHHIVSDGWSIGVMTQELTTLYGAFTRGESDPLPALPVQYADYAVWQRKWVEGEVLQEQAEYWTNTLAGAPELLEIPTDRARPAVRDHRGAAVGLELEETLTAGLKALSQRHGATLFHTLLAGWAATLGRLAGQDDVVVGTPSANRGRGEIEGLIGFFVNTLALRIDLADSPSVAELLGRVKERTLGAQAHQDIPFEQVVERVQPARSTAHTPLFQVMFAWQNNEKGTLELPGLAISGAGGAGEQAAKFDLTLTLQEEGGRIAGSLAYATALFDRGTVERYLGYLRNVLEAMVAEEQTADGIPLLPPAERRRVVEEWNATEAAFPELCIHQLFQEQAERTPHATAVMYEDRSLTYAELNARANRLAHRLRALGVRPDERVAICLERSLEMVVAILGVLKSGGAYVPVDPQFPAERIAYTLADADARVMLTQESVREHIPAEGVLVMDRMDSTDWGEENPEALGGPESLAYVIYTSGSTGRPKGVMIEHRGLVSYACSVAGRIGLGEGASWALLSTVAADLGNTALFPALLTGGTLHVISRERAQDAEGYAAYAEEHGIDCVKIVPSHLAALMTCERPERVLPRRRLVLGGEASRARWVRELARLRPGCEVMNHYGPTETTVGVLTHHAGGERTETLPLGTPLANTRVYVLDARGEPVPVGVAGELYVAGVQVARGYLNQPEMTEERFVADPFHGGRMYRTGDRARWLPEGAIEFLGRADFQVKIRGFRVEPGEIEARLSGHPEVREAVVLAREDAPGDKRLVAYYVADAEISVEALRAHLQAELPDYMVPAAFVHMERLPLTLNGKLDRRALPAPEGGAFLTRAYEAPHGAVEQALAEIWAGLLGVERVGRRDHFFELGGHSLRAVQLVSRVRQTLGVEMALGDLFGRPVLADLAAGMEGARRAELPPIEAADRTGALPLSFAQQRLWFLEQLSDLGSTYHMPAGLRLRGELDRDALRRALDRIVARHEALRTTFATLDGEPVQRITPESAFHLVEHDLRGTEDAEAELRRLVAEEASARFHLEQGPLVRGRLVRLADDDHVLLVTMHHIVSDGWSMGVMTHELTALYGAFARGESDPLPALPVQYADYAAWQRQWVEGEVLQEQAEYWTNTLAGAPELLELPTDRPRPVVRDHGGAALGLELDAGLSAGLKALSQRHGTTLFMTLLAGWAATLGRLSGQEDVVIGTPSANRGRGEIEGLIGFFVNTLALRMDLAGSPTVAELLERVKERTLGAQQHQDIPFEQVVERVRPGRSTSHTPLFQVMFAWHNAEQGTVELPGLTLGGVGGAAAHVTAKFDLTLTLREVDGRIVGGVEYATALFDAATIERHLGCLRGVLAAMVAEEQTVDRLPLLSAAERKRVVEDWNATDREIPSACVHALFERHAERTPQATAVVYGDQSLTYAELNARANRLAHHLVARGVGEYVVLLLPRSVDLVIAELAVLKAGAAYVPVDPTFPAERIAYMVADCGAQVVVSRSGETLPELGAPVRVDVDGAIDGSDENLSLDQSNDAPAYVMYTSGSTGEPKGVVVPHRAIVRLVIDNGYADFNAQDRVAFAANPAFDASTMEVWAPLLNGGGIVVVDQETLLDVGRFATALRTHEVSALWLTVGLFNQYAEALQDEIRRLRYLIVGGDALDPRIIAQVLRRGAPAHLLNGYGPTETTTFAITHKIREVPEGALSIPLGRPISNTRIYILDAHGEPVPAGVVGEIFIGGAGVALGYLDRPELTEGRFVADPFAGGRMYRTGDLGRWLNDGTIEFLGRNDFQVKIRGYRIELGEIEARLAAHEEVRDVVVLAREDAPGDKRLVAYYTAAAEVEGLRAHLQAELPDYMVPAAYVRMERLPLTSNGKLDRKALPAPEGDAYVTRAYEAPEGFAENALAEIWAELLGVERVGRTDDFFELGGHSLRAVQLVSRVRQALGVEVSLGDLFSRPVLADFARGMEGARRAELPPIQVADRGGALPLSFAQQRLWFLEELSDLGATYHIPAGLRLHGALDRDALVRALDRIVARHEALRTTFAMVDGEPVQRITPEGAFHLVRHDLAGVADAEQEMRRLAAEEASARFDLEHGPLIRGRLIRLADDDHVLLVTMHHIVSDGWSMGVMTHELSVLYGAFVRGESDPLPTLPVQYADYAAWQRKWVDGEVLQEQAEYWTRTLSGAPELLELPTDRQRPAVRDHGGAVLGVELDEALSAGLKALSQRNGTTIFHTLLAGWATVLGRLSGQEDVVVGTPSANRGRGEIEGLIGFFVNTLALRMDLAGEPSVAELLGRAKAAALGAQGNQDIPFEQVVERVQPARSTAHTPLFQVMLAWQNADKGTLELPGLTLGSVGGGAERATAKFDLMLTLQEDGGRICGSLTYATALFERETVERHLGYLRRVLHEMAADEMRAVHELVLLPQAEHERLLALGSGPVRECGDDAPVVHLFEAQARRTPDAPAVLFGAEALTYGELDERAGGLAARLRGLGAGAGKPVGVFMERGPQVLVAMLAVWKAGGVYLPLEPTYPAERLAFLLGDSGARWVVCDDSLVDALPPEHGAEIVRVDDASGERAGPVRCAAEDVAYLIYTSGSTGTPKGVMVEHAQLTHTLRGSIGTLGFVPGDVVAALASMAFDISLLEVVAPLLCGAAVRLYPRASVQDPEALVDGSADVTVLHAVPALMREVVEVARAGRTLPALRLLLVGGDSVPADLLMDMRQILAPARTRVLYGPTEAAIICATHAVPQAGPIEGHPLGHPLPNVHLRVCGSHGEMVPVGVAGELWIAGGGVARGYLGREELTAEKFVTLEGARAYRTGDRARWNADGVLEFLGRTDGQVKIRGFRIEPGEIEAVLGEHPAVRQAIVLAREDSPGDKRLVAYFVAAEAVEIEALRAHLSERLPEYMVPSAFVALDAMPLTPNGKLDRKGLPAPGAAAYATQGYEAPVTALESALAEIWGQVLGVERVGRRDHFFERGGHSLLAVRVISRVRQALGVDAALGDLFANPVLAELAAVLEGARRSELPPIEAADRAGVLPLSFAQQRLWFLEQLSTLGSTYHMPAGLRLRGELDAVALRRALDRIVERHEALRTTFTMVDGEPVQRIAPENAFHLVEHDVDEAELRRLVAEEASAPFDLERGPLVRGRLVRLAADDHVLLLTMHHIVSDGWSMGVMTRELGVLYEAFRAGGADPLPALPVQYADYAVWQRRWVEGEVLQQQADYWTRTLAGAPELLELPTDRPRPAVRDHRGAALTLELDETLSDGLRALSQRHGTTLFMTLLAGWATVLGRLSGQEDVVIGTPSANRGRGEIEGLIGFFVNTLALRMDIGGAPTVAELLGRAKVAALGAQQHQDIPFEQVVERVQPARSTAHTPLFQVMFAWQSAEGGKLELPGLTLAPVGGAGEHVTAKFDLSLSLREAEGRIVGGVEYAAALFGRETMERHLGTLRTVLEAMVAEEETIDRLPLLSAAERNQVVEEWNATEAEYTVACIHELFEAQAERTPGAAALVHGDAVLTYAELDARANQLAHHLRNRGVRPDARVAICVERGPEMILGVLAVLKAGGAYVPLDPAYPAERLRYMLEDCSPVALLTHGPLAALAEGTEVPAIDIRAEAAWAGQPRTSPGRDGLRPDHLAYVIYTSGSTGMPKGVMVEHRTVCHLVAAQSLALDVTPESRILQFASFSFDACVFEWVMALCQGASLHLAPAGVLLAGDALAGIVAEQGITHATLPPAVLASLPEDEELPSVRVMVLAGDVLPQAVTRRWSKGRRLLNAYGPTETTVWASVHECDGGRPSIGRPIANTRIYILDAHLQPVPVGVAGEMYIGGAGVARGYLDRPELTEERFVADPFSAGGRMYRTGDLGRWLADGTIDFLGRNDFQVKVRGFRIEPGEIEARLTAHAEVREAAVLAREDAAGEKRLVAYYVADAELEIEALRAHVRARLPEHMVPAAFVWMDRLPLTPNGKLDRKALPAPEGGFDARVFEEPQGETEVALARIWAELLGVERVGRNDHFFQLGGHSLRAVQLVAKIRQVLDVEVALGDVFGRPVLAELARGLRGEADERHDAAIPVRAAGSQAPLFLVHDGAGSTAYAQALLPALDPETPVYALPDVPVAARRPRTVQGMATRLLRMIRQVQPVGPYRLAGWSSGGVLAYEIALQLLGQDETVEFLGMMDTHLEAGGAGTLFSEYATAVKMLRAAEGLAESFELPPSELAAAVNATELAALVRRSHELGVLPEHVTLPRVKELLGRFAADRQARAEYFPTPLPIPVHHFAARSGSGSAAGWQALLGQGAVRVEEVPGTHLSMMQAPHVAELGAALTRAMAAPHPRTARTRLDDSPLTTLRFGGTGEPSLVCVPGAGASVVTFTELAGCLRPAWAVHGLQPRGLDGETLPHTSVEAAADAYLRGIAQASIHGPLHLLGHSFGGWVVFEMARRLRGQGRPVASLTILDSQVPHADGTAILEHDSQEALLHLVEIFEDIMERPLGIHARDIAPLDETGRLGVLHRRLVQLGRMPQRSTPEVLRGPFRAFSACLRTTYRPADIYPDPLRLVLVNDPREDADTTRRRLAEMVEGWRQWAPNLVFTPGPGNHMTALTAPHVQTLAATIAEPMVAEVRGSATGVLSP